MPAEDIHIIPQSITIELIPQSEFIRIRDAKIHLYDKLQLLADMCRANTLSGVKRAGSGHLGSSLSAMDVVVYLYYHEMNTVAKGIDDPGRDIYFSSKGHDVPGLYSVLFSLDILSEEKFLKLRRFGGLDGHPDVGIPGIEANSGSLGMGISKGKGMAWAKRQQKLGGSVFVLTGDGEFQEGQNYEALLTAVQHKVDNLIVIMDNNKVQSDKLVSEITDLGDLEAKLTAFGWDVERCDGHDFGQLEGVFEKFRANKGKPKFLIADTIKGRGVSFMEHPFALKNNKGLYPWHAGAPDDEAYTAAHREVTLRINEQLKQLGLAPLKLDALPPADKPVSGVSKEYVAIAYGDALVELGATSKDLVVLDGDLAIDCRIRGFEAKFPDRFIENGIAEQDMVSTACGLASMGMLPVVNSFSSFLAARANEQIYNSATEKRKIIYACHFAGLIPAGPGKSHQSLRDISLFGALPYVEIIQPCNAVETKWAVNYFVNESDISGVLRLVIGPSPRQIDLPKDYQLTYGQGVTLRPGSDALMIAYGPVMLNEALLASEILEEEGFGLKIVNMPWLNRTDDEWLAELVSSYQTVYVIDDHSPVGGLGDSLLNSLARTGSLGQRRLIKFAVEGFPACGTPAEALHHHRLDGASLAERVKENVPVR